MCGGVISAGSTDNYWFLFALCSVIMENMKSISIGELMLSVYREMLELYNDEDLAAVATADFINKYLKQLQEEEK